MNKKAKKTNTGKKDSTTAKGRVVEWIVALLHGQPGISTERNMWLPTPDGERKREIDVLISGQLAGYPVRIAIECKNYAKAIGKGDIDAFIGKLDDLSFPKQHGIYVCTSKYTKGAIKRAKNAGVRTLLLAGLTKDRLTATIYDALQSIVYLLPMISELEIINEAPTVTLEEMVTFVNEKGESFILLDLIWRNWCTGKYSRTVGEHLIQVEIPEGFTQVQKGKRLNRPKVNLLLHVHALVVHVPGKAQNIELVNPATLNIEKKKISLSFESSSGPFPVYVFKTDAELKKYQESMPQTFKLVVGRIPIPRILTPTKLFWPQGQTYMDNFYRLYREKGDNISLEELDIASLYNGDILKAAYDDIWEGHPVSHQKKGKASE